ncbi:hypothetical protein [Actinomadura sp. 9N407]|uniref:hypothetical protein n=1 Tax=Actinomadura sp. 9N407 TaxID=3375154 RepID=UPI0037ABA0F7
MRRAEDIRAWAALMRSQSQVVTSQRFPEGSPQWVKLVGAWRDAIDQTEAQALRQLPPPTDQTPPPA